MSVFLDTSALFSVMIGNDEKHDSAAKIWNRLLDEGTPLFTTNYGLLETYALLQSRSGMDAVRGFSARVVPYLTVVWVDAGQHARAVEAFLAAGERRLSLVDCSSFIVCRDVGTAEVFAFDQHFEREGFHLLM